MSVSFKVSGGGGVAAARGRLEQAARGGLRRDLERAVATGTARVEPEYRGRLSRRMPQRGGAAREIASRIAVNRARIAYGQRISARHSNFDMRSIERGRLRHPLFGDRGNWYDTPVPPRLFAESVRACDDELREQITAAMRRATRG